MIPFCKDCVHFIANKDISKAMCAKFKKPDLVTGEMKYDTSYNAREDPSKCDTTGIHFYPVPKQNPYNHFGGGL